MRASTGFAYLSVLFAIIGMSICAGDDDVISFTHIWKAGVDGTWSRGQRIGTQRVTTQVYPHLHEHGHWEVLANNPLPHEVSIELKVDGQPTHTSLTSLPATSGPTAIARLSAEPRRVGVEYTMYVADHRRFRGGASSRAAADVSDAESYA